MRSYKQAILSLCDHSGAWSAPFIEQGYVVIRVDPKHAAIDHGGLGYTTGSAGSGHLELMPDGGYGLGMTAGMLADMLEQEGTYCLDERLEQLSTNINNWTGISVDDETEPYAGIEVVGVLIAAPCTDFASSGARWFKDKDADGRTDASISIVKDCLRVVEACGADWWVLENPVGRIARLIPELGEPLLRFDPCDYAGWSDEPDREAYTKRTALYGEFNPDLYLAKIDPVYYYKTSKSGKVLRGSWMWAKLGGKSERTKELRSVTPQGFSRAFAEANG